ncbi:MAG: epimerase [Acidobacteriota bacterium]
MHVLVTGASGFLGRHLVTRLAAGGVRTTALCLERGPLPAAIEFVHADVRDRGAVAAAVAATNPDAIVHLAALSHVGDSWKRMPDYFDVNVLGTEHVAAAATGRRLVFASTAEVYGLVPDDEQPIAESRRPAPRSPYALTKAAAERTALAAGAAVVRLFNLAGSGQLSTFALPSFAAQLAAIERGEGEPVLRVGNLAARRDFVHVDDAVDGLTSLVTDRDAGGIFNLASGRSISIADALDALRRVAGVEARVEVDPERFRPVDVPRLEGDSSRLRGLGWAPRRSLDQALADLWTEARAGGRAA